MTEAQKERILLIRSHLEFVQKSLVIMDTKLDELVTPYENAVTLLSTNPGIDRPSAITNNHTIRSPPASTPLI